MPETNADPAPVLELRSLRTWFHTDSGVVRAVDDVSMVIPAGETLGVVGESGSGKSVTALTVMRLLPDRSARVEGGTVALLGRQLLGLSARAMEDVRGREIAMIFQEPMTSLNPVQRVGDQVAEAVVRHLHLPRAAALERVVALFEEVGLPEPRLRLRSYPHELSGGQKQRVMIAMALACDPALLIADEPTTALDVTIQAQILDLLRRLRDTRRMSILFITHDLGVIAEIADQVCVMYRGRVVEYGPVESVFEQPRHPYTKGLLACRPRLDSPYAVLPTVDDFMERVPAPNGGDDLIREREVSPERLAALALRPHRPNVDGTTMLEVRDLSVWFPIRRDLLGRVVQHLKAVDGVSFDVPRGTTLGLVGESGCGKTTLGRAILRLLDAREGTVRFANRIRGDRVDPTAPLHGADGEREWLELRSLPAAKLGRVRRNLQIVFQDPYASLNPRMTVEAAITEPMGVHGIGADAADRRERAAVLLREVGLAPELLRRYPHEFSGGQRQRICIARALAVDPEFLVCDESVSALDVSVQAQVLNLLKELQVRRGLTYIFISHDLSVVKFMSDTMCVMRDGKIVEHGPSDAIYADPRDAYTRGLIAAIPSDDVQKIKARRRISAPSP